MFLEGKSVSGTVPGIVHHVNTEDSKPFCLRPWRLPETTKQRIHEECNNMESAGVTEPSPSLWLSPVVLVRKKDGSLMFCVDYQNLNSETTADAYPLPRIDELIDNLSATCIFTVLDSRSAYWSVQVAEEDRPKTTFSVGHRLWQFRCLPFGLAIAPTTFQRTVNLVLSSVLGRHTLAYLDVIVHSSTFEQHLQLLDETLSLMAKAGFKLNREKCEFAKTEITFLGVKIGPQGVSPDPEKVRAIAEMPAPRTTRGVRRFLGTTGFLDDILRVIVR